MKVTSTQDRPDLVTVAEAGRLLGVSADTIRRYDAAGKLNSIRTPGNQRRFYREEIETIRTASSAAPALAAGDDEEVQP